MAEISIIVPVYNSERYLHRCVKSILTQSFTNFELILVNDGSSDRSGQLCEEYAKEDHRVRVIHKENGGAADARNVGIDWALNNSNSNWLAFIDSDDWVHREYLKQLYSNAIKYDVELSCCDTYRTMGEEPQVSDNDFLKVDIYTPEEFYLANNMHVVYPDCKLYAKNLFRNIRYPVGIIHEDEYTTYKLVFACERISMVHAELIYYFQNPDGVTRKEWSRRHLVEFDALEEQIAFFYGKNLLPSMMVSIRRYCWHYSYYLSMMKENEVEYHTDIQDLKRRMKQQLKHYRKDLGVPVLGNEDIFCTAYPHEIAMLNRVKRLIKGFRR